MPSIAAEFAERLGAFDNELAVGWSGADTDIGFRGGVICSLDSTEDEAVALGYLGLVSDGCGIGDPGGAEDDIAVRPTFQTSSFFPRREQFRTCDHGSGGDDDGIDCSMGRGSGATDLRA